MSIENIYDINNTSDYKYSDIKKAVDKFKKEYSISFRERVQSVVELLSKDSRKNVINLSNNLLKFLDKYHSEVSRVNSMYEFDREILRKKGLNILCGVDEVGRGPLAGPIVSASVVLDLNVLEEKMILEIKDSKKLSKKKREELDLIIREKALSFNIELLDNKVIDERGIAWCNNEVLKRASEGLKVKPELVLSDGYPIKKGNIRNEYVIKGDNKSASIACASIIAKVYRDNIMKEYNETYPGYGFDSNVGYGAQKHIDSIKSQGPCKIHRKSFLTNILEK
ncbi:ribonuclease HII [Clostridium oceanicum]|uniref:Ribonuclease HII n=1 Tax=Clostridium oceanicum TaxID=1543 RepID=A0ABN1JBF7_9CLOT